MTQKVGGPPLNSFIYSKDLSHNALGQEISTRAPLVNHDILFAARLTIDHYDDPQVRYDSNDSQIIMANSLTINFSNFYYDKMLTSNITTTSNNINM